LSFLQHFPYHPPSKFIICIDNQAAIISFQNNSSNHQFAREAIQQASVLTASGWEITTTWTPAHIGIIGNEEADSLAKPAAEALSPISPNNITTRCWMR